MFGKIKYLTILYMFVAFAIGSLNVKEFQPGWVQGTYEYPPRESNIEAQSFVVFDLDTGTVFDKKNELQPIPPASLTKLVTISLFLEYLKNKGIDPQSEVEIPPEAFAKNMPPRSSLMFLGPGQRTSYNDLLYGLAVDSGNDAATAISIIVGGSTESFVESMNHLVARLGLKVTHFVEPSGYDAQNMTNALEFASFVRWYVKNFDEASNIHATKYFTYPRSENNFDGRQNPITQKNRNELLWTYPGVNGLKTGFIDESGYNIAIKASANNFNIGIVLLGAKSESERAKNATQLLDGSFSDYVSVGLKTPEMPKIKVYKGSVNALSPKKSEFRTTLPKSMVRITETKLDLPSMIEGPFKTTDPLGFVSWYYNGTLVARLGVVPSREIKQDGGINSFFDTVYLYAHGVFGGLKPLSASEILEKAH